jgi:membrane-associated phospholipid phosphatase
MLSLWPTAVVAQEPVVKWADYTSWGTAPVNAVWAAVDAARGERPWCHLGQLAISELLGNGVTIGLKHLVHSPRPCTGADPSCKPDGMPSGHTMNAFLGFDHDRPASGYGVSVAIPLAAGIGTGILRGVAKRHTHTQIVIGAFVGLGSDQAGHLLHCGP